MKIVLGRSRVDLSCVQQYTRSRPRKVRGDAFFSLRRGCLRFTAGDFRRKSSDKGSEQNETCDENAPNDDTDVGPWSVFPQAFYII